MMTLVGWKGGNVGEEGGVPWGKMDKEKGESGRGRGGEKGSLISKHMETRDMTVEGVGWRDIM